MKRPGQAALLGLLVASLLPACAPVRDCIEIINPYLLIKTWEIANKTQEADMLAALYAFREQMQTANSAERTQHYRYLDQTVTDCRNTTGCLQLVLLLSGLEPKLTDYARARNLLDELLTHSPGPLLSGYLRSLQNHLSEREQQQKQLQNIRAELRAERRKSAGLQEQTEALTQEVKTLEQKIKALTTIEESMTNREQVE